MLAPKDVFMFTDNMADILHLPDETLAMTYLYFNKYKRFMKSSETPDPLDPYVCFALFHPLTSHQSVPHSSEDHDSISPLYIYIHIQRSHQTKQTLALAALSLASKATEHPQRLHDLILPAHTSLHLNNPTSTTKRPLSPSSTYYSILHKTLLNAELLLLRTLRFDLLIPTPLDFLPRYLNRAMAASPFSSSSSSHHHQDSNDSYDMHSTRIGRLALSFAIDTCKDPRLGTLFPARALAAGSVWVACRERGLVSFPSHSSSSGRGVKDDDDDKKEGGKGEVGGKEEEEQEQEQWVKEITGGKVDVRDFREVLALIPPRLS